MKWSLLCSFLLSLPAQAMVVAVDPGHGGIDHGATFQGVHESDIVLNVSKKLVNIINQDESLKAVLTRKDASGMELRQRLRLAREAKAELFVSVHANSSTDKKSKGMEIYFRNELEPDGDSLRLAHQENQIEGAPTAQKKKKSDLQGIVEDLKRTETSLQSYELSWHITKEWQVPYSRPRQQPIKQGPFHVINHSEFPSVLVEIGFVSNPKEIKRLASAEYQEEIARAIFQGIKDFQNQQGLSESPALSR